MNDHETKASPRTSRLTLGDIEVNYRQSGGGPRVVLIHGLAQDHRMWSRQQAHLQGLTTIAYDVRGHGETTLGEADGTVDQLAQDLINLLERVGPSAVAGFSLGGTVALTAAASRPDLVSSVIAMATSSVVGSAAAGFFNERIETFESGDRQAIENALAEDTRAQLDGSGIDPDPVIAARIEAVGEGGGYVNGARAMAAINERPLNPTLEQVKSHVRVVGGERDSFCPRRAADIMLEHLPNASFEELPGVGHLFTDEAPDQVDRVLEEQLGPGADR